MALASKMKSKAGLPVSCSARRHRLPKISSPSLSASVAHTIRETRGEVRPPVRLRTGFWRVDNQRSPTGQHRQPIKAPLAPLKIDLVRLGERNKMTDRPSDHVAISVKVAFTALFGFEDTGTVSCDGEAFRPEPQPLWKRLPFICGFSISPEGIGFN